MVSGRVHIPSWYLWVIVAIGGVLRFVPIWFGLPYLHARPDEGEAVGHAVAILGGDLNPHFFHWPSLTFYLFAAAFAAASGLHGLLPGAAPLGDVDYFLVGRAIVAAAGTLTIVVLYRLAQRCRSEVAALLAAAFLAVAMLHVRDSHFAMTDVLMTLFVTASLGTILGALDDAVAAGGRSLAPLRFAAAGLLGGLAASTKYSAAAIVLAMGAAQFVIFVRFKRVWPPRLWLPSVAFAAALVIGFLAATPYAVLDFATFAADLTFDFTHLSGGHGIDLGRGWTYHLTRSLPYGTGIPTVVAAIAGIVVLAKRRPRQAFVLLAFAAGFHASIGSGYTVFFRYVLPLVPIVCVLAAFGVRGAGPWMARRTGLAPATGVAILATLVVFPSLVNAVWFDVLLARTDTRVLAAEWLAPRVQPEDSVYDSGGDYATLDLGRTRYHPWRFDPATGSFGHPMGHTPDWLVLHQSPLRTYGNHPAALRRLAQEKYALVWEVRATRGAASSATYDLQDAFFLPLSGFQTVTRPGPTIMIYRRRDAVPIGPGG